MRSKPSPASEDAELQSAVLSLVLTEHPTQMTRAELVRDLTTSPKAIPWSGRSASSSGSAFCGARARRWCRPVRRSPSTG